MIGGYFQLNTGNNDVAFNSEEKKGTMDILR